jgi:hypothetical protein
MDRKCMQWTGIAALLLTLAACVAYPPQQRLPPKDAPSMSPAAVAPDSVLALSKAVPEAGASMVAAGEGAAAQPRAVAPSPPPADVREDAETERARALQQALVAWQQAWQAGDIDRYIRAYDARFKGTGRARKAWEKDKRQRLAAGGITVRISDVQWKQLSNEVAEARFLQHFEQGRYRDVGHKTLRLRRTDAGWRITHESWRRRR